MAIFPELVPHARTFNFGEFPHSTYSSNSHAAILLLHKPLATNYELTLTYQAIDEAHALLIRSHYGQNAGTHGSFHLPFTAWKGLSFSAGVAPINLKWRYASPPEEIHLGLGKYEISVALVSADYDSNSALEFSSAITGGSAGGGSSGSIFSVSTSLNSGSASIS